MGIGVSGGSRGRGGADDRMLVGFLKGKKVGFLEDMGEI